MFPLVLLSMRIPQSISNTYLFLSKMVSLKYVISPPITLKSHSTQSETDNRDNCWGNEILERDIYRVKENKRRKRICIHTPGACAVVRGVVCSQYTVKMTSWVFPDPTHIGQN
jgi:hypothetical protein